MRARPKFLFGGVDIACTLKQMVTTTMTEWGMIPDIIGDGVSEQEEIMTAICETKGATFDGTDCVGELDDSTVFVSTHRSHGSDHKQAISPHRLFPNQLRVHHRAISRG